MAQQGTEPTKPTRKTATKKTTTKKTAASSSTSERNTLVIVESPAKAKTISRYLGRGYVVKASMGHVRDLPKSRLGVQTDDSFAPDYLVPRDKSKVVKELRESVKSAKSVLLATDPDREGEAIAWHLIEATQPQDKVVQRIVFQE